MIKVVVRNQKDSLYSLCLGTYIFSELLQRNNPNKTIKNGISSADMTSDLLDRHRKEVRQTIGYYT